MASTQTPADDVGDDGKSNEDIVYLILIGGGVLVLTLGLLYCICRICCYDFWARCCGRMKGSFKSKKGRGPANDGTRWGTMDKKELMRQVILARNRERQQQETNQWAAEQRRASDVSFAGGDDDDHIIYHENEGYMDSEFDKTFRRLHHDPSASSGFGNSLSVPGALPGAADHSSNAQYSYSSSPSGGGSFPARRKSDTRNYY